MIVVDTNILMYHLLPGPRNKETEALVRLDQDWAAPVLWRSELRNVLSGYLRRRDLTSALAREIVEKGRAVLKGGEYAVEDSTVFNLVKSSRCTSYDCEFVALAAMFQVRLVTEDQALLRDFPQVCSSLAQALQD